MQNNQNGQKTTFKWPKRIPKVFFSRFRGVIWSIKVVSDFRFRHRKYHFWYPHNRKIGQFLRFWGYEKWHLWCPKRKSETTFIDQITPLNLGKITSGTHFRTLKVGFWPFHYFGIFLSRFQSVKTPKTKSADLPIKMTSNQKNQENKPALKFNFT